MTTAPGKPGRARRRIGRVAFARNMRLLHWEIEQTRQAHAYLAGMWRLYGRGDDGGVPPVLRSGVTL